MAEQSKNWIPLESNPEVLNTWAEKAGLVVTQDKFVDVLGFDPDLLALVPQPVKAIILLYPVPEEVEKRQKEEDSQTEGKIAVDPTVVWIKQTIHNACGTMGLLHAIMNSPITLRPGCPIQKFIDDCLTTKSPEERAELLEKADLFEDMHAEAASAGQSAIPPDNFTDKHYTCFVQAPSVDHGEDKGASGMRLIELDGDRLGPIDRGPCTDLLKDTARFVQENIVALAEDINFCMLALAASHD